MERLELGRLIVDAKGTEKPVYDTRPIYPDKKQVSIDPLEYEQAVELVKSIKEKKEIKAVKSEDCCSPSSSGKSCGCC